MTMGQGQSSSEFSELKTLQTKLQSHISVLTQIATLSYKDLLKTLEELNKITSTFTDSKGKQLRFALKNGTDTTVFWKATIRIRCYKVNVSNNRVESCRSLNLRQYSLMYREITDQVGTLSNLTSELPREVTASAIFNEFGTLQEGKEDENECCICMDRKAEIILPCNHNFCEICIDSWTSGHHHNCPLCRGMVAGADDTWVLTEKPDSSDYETEVKGYLVGLADRTGEPQP